MSDSGVDPGFRVELSGDGRIRVSGALVFATVPAVRAQSLRRFAEARHLHIDLGGVTHADSAGLALMIEWMREARRRRHQIHFSHIPEALRVIAELSDVDDLLPA